MDITNTNSTDDQELAKVLEDMNQQAGSNASANEPAADAPADDAATTDQPAADEHAESTTDGLSFEEAPVPNLDAPVTPPASDDAPVSELPTPAVSASVPSASPELDSIKKTALEELRPLVDKLDLPADEKFNTLLLLIRSTDDKSLVSAAHDAAKAIEDETKRAQALLDVIKEIDYFSGHGTQPQ
jgi:hypothetical protein